MRIAKNENGRVGREGQDLGVDGREPPLGHSEPLREELLEGLARGPEDVVLAIGSKEALLHNPPELHVVAANSDSNHIGMRVDREGGRRLQILLVELRGLGADSRRRVIAGGGRWLRGWIEIGADVDVVGPGPATGDEVLVAERDTSSRIGRVVDERAVRRLRAVAMVLQGCVRRAAGSVNRHALTRRERIAHRRQRDTAGPMVCEELVNAAGGEVELAKERADVTCRLGLDRRPNLPEGNLHLVEGVIERVGRVARIDHPVEQVPERGSDRSLGLLVIRGRSRTLEIEGAAEEVRIVLNGGLKEQSEPIEPGAGARTMLREHGGAAAHDREAPSV